MGRTVRSRPLESVAPSNVLCCPTAPVSATAAVSPTTHRFVATSSDKPLIGNLCFRFCFPFCVMVAVPFEFKSLLQFLLAFQVLSNPRIEGVIGLIREQATRSRRLRLSLVPHCVHG